MTSSLPSGLKEKAHDWDWDINCYQLNIHKILENHKINNPQLIVDLQNCMSDCITRDRQYKNEEQRGKEAGR